MLLSDNFDLIFFFTVWEFPLFILVSFRFLLESEIILSGRYFIENYRVGGHDEKLNTALVLEKAKNHRST